MPIQKYTFKLWMNFLQELDLKTYMIEDPTKQKGARFAYHVLHGLTKSIQLVVEGIFKSYKNFTKFVSNTKNLSRKYAYLFGSLPMAAKKTFWPSQADLLEKRTNELTKLLLQPTTPSLFCIIGKGEKELSHGEKKELILHWLAVTLPSSDKKILDVMDRIADGDVSDVLLHAMEKEVFDLSENIKKQFPLLPRAISAFIEIFKEERIVEARITPQNCVDNPTLLLKHPNLLKRKDIRTILQALKPSLRAQIVSKKNRILQRSLKNTHQSENQALHALPRLLKKLSADEIQKKYLSSSEKNYISKRMPIIHQRINQLKNQALQEQSFELRVLQLELHSLSAQKMDKDKAEQVFSNVGNQTDQINTIIEEETKEICHRLVNRIEDAMQLLQNSSVSSGEIKNLRIIFEELKKESPENFLLYVGNRVMQKLQSLEKIAILSSSDDTAELLLNNPAVTHYLGYYEKITLLHNGSPWKEMAALKTVNQRQEEKETKFANDVILLCLEKKPECQLPLLLANQTFLTSGLNKQKFDKEKEAKFQVQQSASKFVASIQEQHLATFKKALFSFTEFTEELKKDKNLPIIDAAQNSIGEIKLNVATLALTLTTTEPLNQWYSSLQKIWSDNLSLEHEEVILTISNRAKQEKKMEEYFTTWFQTITGRKINLPLSFKQITIKDLSEEREAALNRLKQHSKGFKLSTERAKERLTEAKQMSQANSSLQGFEFSIIGHQPPHVPVIPKDHPFYPPFIQLDSAIQPSINPIERIMEARKTLTIQTPGIQQRIEWIKQLLKNSHAQHIRDLKLHVLAEYRAIAQECYENKILVPIDMITLFTEFYGIKTNQRLRTLNFSKFAIDEFSNSERTEFFNIYLWMCFAGAEKVNMSAKSRSYLIQFLALSNLPSATVQKIKDSIEVYVNGTGHSDLPSSFKGIGKKLQDSAICLEGIEEHTIQKTIQNSLKAEELSQNKSNIRGWIDALRARSTEDLSEHLLQYIETYYSLAHDQGREAIERALEHILSNKDLDQALLFIENRIKAFNNTQLVDENTLAPPPYIFYKDLLSRIDPSQSDQTIELFNTSLIQSDDANRMLMGYAREITRLSLKVKQQLLTPHEFYILLKYKIAYQKIKISHFDGKMHIQGFLKIEVDRADTLMSATALDIQKYLTEAFLDDLSKKFQNIAVDPTYADRVFREEMKRANGTKVFSQELPGWIGIGARAILDVSLGVIYNNGIQQAKIPVYLQNDPAIRALNLHYLPYIRNPQDGSFIYYTKEYGLQIPQVTIKDVGGQLVIQKRVVLEGKIKYLQYIPKEKTHLPISVSERLGVKFFWQSSKRNLYGYNQEGDLLVSIQKGDRIFIQGEEYQQLKNPSEILNQADIEHLSFLEPLLNTFPLEEILLHKDKKIFFIPAIGLKIRQSGNSWICERQGMESKVVDLSISSHLIFKSEKSALKTAPLQRQLKEQRYRLQQIKGSSHIDKYVMKTLEQQIASLESALLDSQERFFITMPPILANGPVQPLVFKISNTLFASTILPGSLSIVENTIKEEIKGVTSTDLTSALILVKNQIQRNVDKQETIDSLIAELAKYPLNQPLSPVCLTLLNEAISSLDQTDHLTNELRQFSFYLQLMRFTHFSYRMQELAHTPLADKKNTVADIEDNYEQATEHCEGLALSLESSKIPLNKELLSLWNQSGFKPESLLLQRMKPHKVRMTTTIKSPAVEEIQTFARETLLERFFVTHGIIAEAKNPNKELSAEQLSLIQSFRQHSPEQVAGFYLEELGRFTLKGFEEEFKVNKATRKGLFGLKSKDVKEIFSFLERKKYISKDLKNSYFLQSADEKITPVHGDEIRALLADKALSKEQIEKIVHRLDSFLFKVMQSGFKFSFKSGIEKEIDQKLEEEKQLHIQKQMEAEAILKPILEQAKLSLTDVKYAVISGDFTYFSNLEGKEIKRMSNAMLRFLFHKTEVQHIVNIQKAPRFGERNKIELLQTKRNYSVDLLFQEGLTGEANYEQIMQRAFLVFEENYGYRCNMMQIRMFRSLLLDTTHEEAIDAAQARMGFGKTALLPLIAIIRIALERKSSHKHLVRYVVPKAVIEDNTSAFNQRLSAILGSHAVKDRDFVRYQIDTEMPEHSLELIKRDLAFRLDFYRKTIQRGDVLIQWPEIRNSMEAQELDFGKMIVANEYQGRALDLCLECKRLLGNIRSLDTYTIFDELDDTQDIKSREVNFTTGIKIPIPTSTIVPTEKLISYISQNREKDWTDITSRAKEMVIDLCTDVNGLKMTHCPEGLSDYLTNRSQEINKDVENILSPHLKTSLVSGNGQYTENDSLIFLIRAVLLDEHMLAIVKNKQPNTHFGVRFVERQGEKIYSDDPESQSPLLIAVPYEGTNTPKGLSVFDNTEVAAITTIRYYLSSETPLLITPHLDFLLTQLKKDKIPAHLSQHYLGQVESNHGKTALELLKEITYMLDEEEIKIKKLAFYKEFMQIPSQDFRKFFAMAVVATQIRSDEASAKSDRYEKGSVDNVEKGCSGTVGETSSYFAKQAIDPAADGKMSIEIMGRSNNADTHILKDFDATKDYLKQIISHLLEAAKPNTRAIVDAAGMCKSSDGTPETVVTELWKQLQENPVFSSIEGIIFYGRDNVKKLYRGPTLLPIPCTTQMELDGLKERKYFSFYGQKNTRGSDIKQAFHTHRIITLDENVPNNDVKQAILRFRDSANPDSEQTFTFAIMQSFEIYLKEKTKVEVVKQHAKVKQELQNLKVPMNKTEEEQKQWFAENTNSLQSQLMRLEKKISTIGNHPPKTKEIANFLRLQEKDTVEKAALTIFRKEMKGHIRQAAAHLEHDILKQLADDLTPAQHKAYRLYLQERNAICSFTEKSLLNLYAKYGRSTQAIHREDFVSKEQEIANTRLKELFKAAEKFANAANVSLTLHIDRYTPLIDKSVHFFKGRFEATTPVEINNADAEAQAIAQAIAEALAQAEAESLAENLAEQEVHVLSRAKLPALTMPKQPYVPIDLSFLTNPALWIPIQEYPLIGNLINPDLCDAFKVSPFLKENEPLITSFFLAKANEPYIFVTQHEADMLLKMDLQERNGYSLYDARDLKINLTNGPIIDLNQPEIQQILCAIVGDNHIPKQISNTAELRVTNLTNVNSPQLLPKMEIKNTPLDKPLEVYFKIRKFGVKKETDFSIEINPNSSTELSITVGSAKGPSSTIIIPKTNKYLNNAIIRGFKEAHTSKITHVRVLINNELKKYEELKNLKEEKERLDELAQKTKETIEQIKDFTITDSMIDGLKIRDDEFLRKLFNELKETQSGNPAKNPVGYMHQFGEEFLSALETVNLAQKSFAETGSTDNLQKLKESFEKLVSNQTIAFIANKDNKSTPLFSRKEWNEIGEFNYKDKFKPLETIYGRILYTVHDGDLRYARDCPRKDCNNMFSKTLPDLIKAIQSINQAIDVVKECEKQREIIQAKINQIMQTSGLSPEAVEQMFAELPELTKALELSETIWQQMFACETELGNAGVQFEMGKFLDQFHLENFMQWNENIYIEGKVFVPEYESITYRTLQDYKSTIKDLSVEESSNFAKNQKFTQIVKNLAQETVDRTPEIKYI